MQKSQGITLIGMLLTAVVVGVIGIIVMRIVPVYIQYYEVINSVKSLNSLPSTEFSVDVSSNAMVLRSKLMNQLYVNSIESIKPEQITFDPDGEGAFKVSIKYTVIQPLIANVSLLFNFETVQEVKASAS